MPLLYERPDQLQVVLAHEFGDGDVLSVRLPKLQPRTFGLPPFARLHHSAPIEAHFVVLSLDLVGAVFFVIVLPVYGYFVGWPRFQRRLAKYPDTARLREYRLTLFLQWVLTIAAAMVFMRGGRGLSQLGVRLPAPVPGLISGVLIAVLAVVFVRQALLLRRSAAARARVRAQVAGMRSVLPHTSHEMSWFYLLSLTAGICEEFLYRGFVPTVLAPLLTWWGAAIVAVVAFGFGHAYQGRSGILRTAGVGLVFACLVAFTGSLFPAMALHALVDVGSGMSIHASMGED